MSRIHPSAIVHPKAELGEDVEVGPFTIIEEDTIIGARTKIGPHVQICRWTSIGEDCEVFFGSTLGNPSKDMKYKGWRSYTRIGSRNILREYVSISRATPEDGATIVGDDNLFMNWTNIAHDSIVGSHVIMANFATLGGHVEIEDHARIGAKASFHQFVRVGKRAMAGACAKFVQDLPPFMVGDGYPAVIRGLNTQGLSTAVVHAMRGIPKETLANLKQAYRLLYRSKLNVAQAVQRIREEIPGDPEIDYLVDFIESSKRGIATR